MRTEQVEDQPPAPPVYVPYEEADYRSRIAKPKYQHLKDLEDQILAIQKDNVKVIVVCAGLWYGMGENLFKEHFKVLKSSQRRALGYRIPKNCPTWGLVKTRCLRFTSAILCAL